MASKWHQNGNLDRLKCHIASATYWTIKSKSEKANMTMLSSVDTAPCTTGANINSSAIWVRRLRPPMLVTNPYCIKHKTIN